LKDIFAVQDDLTKNIITAMQVKLTEGEQAKVDAKGTDNLQAYLKCLQAREQINRFNLESNEIGKKLAQESIELDPQYALAFSYSLMGKHEEAIATAEKAVALDPNSANTHAMHGHTLRMADKPEKAILAYKKAIRLNPIPPTFYLFGLGLSYSLAGQYDQGTEWCEKAVQNDPDSFFPRLIMAAVYSNPNPKVYVNIWESP
jgi:adenylate cyclase